MNKLIITALTALIALTACVKTKDNRQPLGPDDGTPPAPVSDIRVKPIPGGAVLHYTRPGDLDLGYIKARYYSSRGTPMEVCASSYVDSLKIEGLGDTNEYQVQLFSVDQYENYSSPVTTTIRPLTPPVETVFASLVPKVGFGGFLIGFENQTRSDIAVYVIRRDSLGTFDVFDAAYTSMSGGDLSIRGLPSVENDFGFFVRDRYNNFSDTLFLTATPWPESELDKKRFSDFDNPTWSFVWGVYDGVVEWGNYSFITTPYDFPHYMNIDLGVLAKLSRMKIWQRVGDDTLFQHGMPKSWRMYGKSDMAQAEWTLLMECNSFKPSGLPIGQYSTEDWEYAEAGEEFMFPLDAEPVRYLRFEFLSTWGGYKGTAFSEFSVWGEVIDNAN